MSFLNKSHTLYLFQNEEEKIELFSRQHIFTQSHEQGGGGQKRTVNHYQQKERKKTHFTAITIQSVPHDTHKKIIYIR